MNPPPLLNQWWEIFPGASTRAPPHSAAAAGNTVYVIAVMTSLNCGVDVLCLRAVKPNTYLTLDDCLAARDRLVAQNEALRRIRLKCVPKSAALPYAKND